MGFTRQLADAYEIRAIPRINPTGDTLGACTPASAQNGATIYLIRHYPAMSANGKADVNFGIGQA